MQQLRHLHFLAQQKTDNNNSTIIQYNITKKIITEKIVTTVLLTVS